MFSRKKKRGLASKMMENYILAQANSGAIKYDSYEEFFDSRVKKILTRERVKRRALRIMSALTMFAKEH